MDINIKRWFIIPLIWAMLVGTLSCGSSSTSSDGGDQDGDDDDDNPIIRLFYYGETMQGEGGDPGAYAAEHKIYSATSIDGMTFTEESGVRFELENITDPDAFYDGAGTYIIFTSQGRTIVRATSSTANGTYTQDTTFSWNNGAVCSTTQIGSNLVTYYCGTDSIGAATYSPSVATLTDLGEVFQNPHGGGTVCDPSVVQLADGTYLMFYKYQPAGNENAGPSGHQIYTATSPDGYTWTASMELIRNQASVPGAVLINGVIYLYFVDGSTAPETLGYGISTDEGATFTFGQVTISDAVESLQVDPHPTAIQ